MRRNVIFFVAVLLFFTQALSARSLFEVGLSFSGIYENNTTSSNNQIFDGMGKGENWTLGFGLSSRFSILELSMMAMLPKAGEQGSDALALLSSATLNFPLVTKKLYASAGGGLSTAFVFPADDSETKINGKDASTVNFEDVLRESPIHLRFGLDFLIGSAKFGLHYIKQSLATITSLEETNGWGDLFKNGGNDKIALIVQLALF
jgi:hypothetical protein